MTHRYVPLNWIQWVTLILCAAVAVEFAWSDHRFREVQHHQNDALSSLICRAEHIVQKTPTSPQFTWQDKERALRFYRNAQKDSHLSPCS